MNLFTVFILSLFLTIALVPVFKRLAFRMNIVDVPNARKVHAVPMPKTGGISMALGAFIPMLLWLPRDPFVSSLFIGAGIIVVFGVIDDIKTLGAIQKFVPQIAATVIVVVFGGVRFTCFGDLLPASCTLPAYLSIPFTVFAILGVTNAINLADGLDGLAGGISMLSYILIVFLALNCGNHSVAIIAVAMAGGIAGFLRFNTHPAVLFMGDAGSQLLGFVLAVLVVALTQANTPYAKILGLPLIGFPILDTLTVMSERVIKGKSPFAADKNHFHHRLLRFGFFHTEAVLLIYITQALFMIMALIFRFYSDWFSFLGFVSLSLLILLVFFIGGRVKWKFRREGTFDSVVKRRLKTLKDQKLFIRTFFGGIRFGFPLVFGCQALVPVKISMLVSAIAAGLMAATGITYFFDWSRYRPVLLRFSVYILAPLTLYAAENDAGIWMTEFWLTVNNLGFIALILFVIMTMNLTRRRQGFKVTPMDILVFIVILVFPNLPSVHFEAYHAGMVLAKVLVILYSYDVLMGELRHDTERMVLPMMIALGAFVVRALV